jgi:hypothetical protein
LKNFPHQYNQLSKLEEALRVASILIDGEDELRDDGVYGYALARAHVYTFRGLDEPAAFDLEVRIGQEKQKPIGSQGARTAARETRRTLSLLHFLEFTDDNYKLAPEGQRLLYAASQNDVRGRAIIWRRCLWQLELIDQDGHVSHPIRLMLRLLGDGPLGKLALGFALEALDDSEEEFQRIHGLAISADIDAAYESIGTPTAQAPNSVKILPALAEQVGLITISSDSIASILPLGQRVAKGIVPRPAAIRPSTSLPIHRKAMVRPFKSDREPGTLAPTVPLTPEEQHEAQERLRERSAEHERILKTFALLFDGSGADLKENPLAFDFTASNSAAFVLLCEAKSIGNTDERIQVRLAVGQLSYYEYFDVIPLYDGATIAKVLLVNRPLSSDMRDYLSYLQIELVVVSDDGFELSESLQTLLQERFGISVT